MLNRDNPTVTAPAAVDRPASQPEQPPRPDSAAAGNGRVPRRCACGKVNSVLPGVPQYCHSCGKPVGTMRAISPPSASPAPSTPPAASGGEGGSR